MKTIDDKVQDIEIKVQQVVLNLPVELKVKYYQTIGDTEKALLFAKEAYKKGLHQYSKDIDNKEIAKLISEEDKLNIRIEKLEEFLKKGDYAFKFAKDNELPIEYQRKALFADLDKSLGGGRFEYEENTIEENKNILSLEEHNKFILKGLTRDVLLRDTGFEEAEKIIKKYSLSEEEVKTAVLGMYNRIVNDEKFDHPGFRGSPGTVKASHAVKLAEYFNLGEDLVDRAVEKHIHSSDVKSAGRYLKERGESKETYQYYYGQEINKLLNEHRNDYRYISIGSIVSIISESELDEKVITNRVIREIPIVSSTFLVYVKELQSKNLISQERLEELVEPYLSSYLNEDLGNSHYHIIELCKEMGLGDKNLTRALVEENKYFIDCCPDDALANAVKNNLPAESIYNSMMVAKTTEYYLEKGKTKYDVFKKLMDSKSLSSNQESNLIEKMIALNLHEGNIKGAYKVAEEFSPDMAVYIKEVLETLVE